jgi:hypothetical protein
MSVVYAILVECGLLFVYYRVKQLVKLLSLFLIIASVHGFIILLEAFFKLEIEV